MLFNSAEFCIFLPLVFFFYWFVFSKNLKLQNVFLLFVSYIFYSWWDYRFVFLLILSTIIDYGFGLIIHNSTNRKKFYLWLSIINNLGILGFFKYYNFFADSAKQFLAGMGFQVDMYILQIALPVGISFYTFHGMSYVIDIYHGKAKPIKDFVDYALFVCFFPLLVAGPIERAHHLLPQVMTKRAFDTAQASDGIRLIIWGFFKKIVIADNCAPIVNSIFANYEQASSFELLLGAFFFAIQIYCDFSGYSDIALGVAKLFGFELLINFRTPYFSRDVAEFWRRWHISLTTWFRDYVYIPLGGSKTNRWNAVRNTFIVFILSGFWHGANWTFIAWGFLNALYFSPLLLTKKNRVNLDTVAQDRPLPNIKELLQMLGTFVLICITWVFFRSNTLGDAANYIGGIFTHEAFGTAYLPLTSWLVILIVLWVIVEWQGRTIGISAYLGAFNPVIRKVVYVSLVFLIGMYGAFEETEFIYFQF